MRLLPHRPVECETVARFLVPPHRLHQGARLMARGNFRSISDGLTANQRFRKRHGTESDRKGVEQWRKDNPSQSLDNQLRKYGIDSFDFNAMLIEQGGVCKICGKPETGKRKRLSVDHCHKTGVIRGLLCNTCNLAIGWFNHDPELIRAALRYLECKPVG